MDRSANSKDSADVHRLRCRPMDVNLLKDEASSWATPASPSYEEQRNLARCSESPSKEEAVAVSSINLVSTRRSRKMTLCSSVKGQKLSAMKCLSASLKVRRMEERGRVLRSSIDDLSIFFIFAQDRRSTTRRNSSVQDSESWIILWQIKNAVVGRPSLQRSNYSPVG